MRIRNDLLPEHLQGKNAPDYIHNVESYKHCNFTINLKKWKVFSLYRLGNYGRRVGGGKEGIKGGTKMDFGKNTLSQYEQSLADLGIRRIPQNGVVDQNFEPIFKTIFKPEPEPIIPINTCFLRDGETCKVDWSDGTSTVVVYGGEDEWNADLAMTIAFIKKFHGLKAYKTLLNSLNKKERDEQEAAAKKRAEQEAAEEKRKARYRKAVKKAARRARKRAQFKIDVQNELENEFF